MFFMQGDFQLLPLWSLNSLSRSLQLEVVCADKFVPHFFSFIIHIFQTELFALLVCNSGAAPLAIGASLDGLAVLVDNILECVVCH